MTRSTLALLAVLVVAGCSSTTAPPDARPADDAIAFDAPRVPVACGSGTCSTEQVCRIGPGGFDAGPPDGGPDTGPPPGLGQCVSRPPACASLVDCDGGMGPGNCTELGFLGCLAELCYSIDDPFTRMMAEWVSVTDGRVYCVGS